MLCEKAGCDLLTQTPEIKNWLNEVIIAIITPYNYLFIIMNILKGLSR
jgi:hypothetical protein